jgi:hypothetical protein
VTQGYCEQAGVAQRDVRARRVMRTMRAAAPESSNAIRVDFNEDEPPAVLFNDLAVPAALVSWAWCQLKMLDTLLLAASANRGRADGDADVAGAVRNVIGPVINALALSELRAAELRNGDTP